MAIESIVSFVNVVYQVWMQIIMINFINVRQVRVCMKLTRENLQGLQTDFIFNDVRQKWTK